MLLDEFKKSFMEIINSIIESISEKIKDISGIFYVNVNSKIVPEILLLISIHY